jgi:uncharacterized protein YjdB
MGVEQTTAWETEPNDGFAHANAMPLQGTVSGTIDSAEDRDWFTFSVETVGEWTLGFSAKAPGSWVAELYSQPGVAGAEKQLLQQRFDGIQVVRASASLQPGVYHLRVRPGDDSAVGAVYSLDAAFRAYAPVTSIAFAQQKVTLVKGKRAKLGTVAYTEDGSAAALHWESGNPAVAVVGADGTIKAVKKGKTQVVVRAENGVQAKVSVQVVTKKKALKSVTIKSAPARLAVGKAKRLGASLSPAAATGVQVKWKSSKPKVLQVDAAGRLVAKKVGTATITVKAGGLSARCKVRVVAPVTAVRLPQKTLSLQQGKRLTMPAVATTTDGKKAKLLWSSGDAAVATVSAKGKISAVGPGKTTVVVRAENGKKAKLKVRVVAKAKALKRVAISGLPGEMAVGQTVRLAAKLTPGTATGVRPKYTSSNTAVVRVDAAGTTVAVGRGEAEITVVAGKRRARKTVRVT